ncbi:MAG: adenosylcobalamin-dependent ribonucleoside-diphosphate reductase [Gammaproteobacteria bacterium]|nr:adenosylcobalamin-dependent ribonucleoside-diphosphate reductase [Gammaproteobacteria bacterium]
MSNIFDNDISREIWASRYRYECHDRMEEDITDSWRRIARALAEPETDKTLWEKHFYQALDNFRFLPGGRIQAGIGTNRKVTLFNCFVMGQIEDSMNGIFTALKQGALTMQQGGGVGYDFSSLRPAGTAARHTGTIASGPVSFMQIWDSMCATLLSSGNRRGAMMATLRCDHPDIETFIDAKASGGLHHFNLSVLVTDNFMQAVNNNESWPLIFPMSAMVGAGITDTMECHWGAAYRKQGCTIVRTVSARELWQKIMRANYDYAEPGVLFIDRINRTNNLYYREHISATNPCGEIPLPPYGACDLGSLNLAQFVDQPFSAQAGLNLDDLLETVRHAVRMLDNVIDLSHYPLPEQERQAHGSRRVGLGITGLADFLMMLNLDYGSKRSLHVTSDLMKRVCVTAYETSVELAREKGSFPFLDKNAYLQSVFIRKLPEHIREGIREHGIRNSHLLAIAPTGTVSLLANNVSSSLEPVFSRKQRRRIIGADGQAQQLELQDYACIRWQQLYPGKNPVPPHFVDSHSIDPLTHLRMQSAIQEWVDNAVSKTINMPESLDFDDFIQVYYEAWKLGLKGCTSFRPNKVTGSVIEQLPETSACCGAGDGSD